MVNPGRRSGDIGSGEFPLTATGSSTVYGQSGLDERSGSALPKSKILNPRPQTLNPNPGP